MKFEELYYLIETLDYRDETPKVQIDDLIIHNKKQNGKSFRISFSNGAYTIGMIRPWFNPETFDESEYSIGITKWGATPAHAIMDRGLSAEKDFKNKGFASKSFNEILKIAKDLDINIFTIWAPTNDSQKVIQNYVNKKIIIPIESSKAAYGDYYTEFIINWPIANSRLN